MPARDGPAVVHAHTIVGNGARSRVTRSLADGPYPADDGWDWLYRLFARLAPAGTRRRRLVCRYFLPGRLERWRWGGLYRLMGVHLFGAVIPTGGIAIRRLTGARMMPYTLHRRTLQAARGFYYRTCVFEALHLPFLLALLGISLDRALAGRLDLAAQDMVVNLLVNVLPILHHRRTRSRIVGLLVRAQENAARRHPAATSAAPPTGSDGR